MRNKTIDYNVNYNRIQNRFKKTHFNGFEKYWNRDQSHLSDDQRYLEEYL